MKKIDSYILKKFLSTFVFSIILIISISIVFDFSEKIDDFIDRNAPLRAIIFDYYLNFIPFFIYLFAYLFTFISVIFFTSRMAANSEIIAILSNGMSFRRLMFPYFLGASVIFLLSFVLGSFIIPKSSKVKLAFEEKYYKNANIGNQKNIHKQVSPGVYIYLQSFDGRRDTGQGFSIEKFDNGELISKLVAVSIRWDSINNNWRLLDYYIRNIDGMHEEIITGREIDSTMNFTPDEFRRRANVVESMTTPELNRFIESEISRGSDNIETYKIEKYRRLSSPFAVFILTLIGVSLSSRKVKGGLGLNIGFGLLLSFSYILFMRVSKVFSVSGDLDPLIAVWIPNIVFTCIAIILYITTPK